jgi:hypothetical protein
MSDKQTKLAEEILSEVLSSIELPENITKIEKFGLQISINNSKGKAIINYDLLAATEWIVNKNENEFIDYWKESGENDQDVYFSLYDTFVISASTAAIEILIQQLTFEFEDVIQTLAQLAVTLNECISNEYSKEMFAKGEFPEQADSKKIIDKFTKDAAKTRKIRMMKPINEIKDQSKPDLKQMAIYYEKLLPIWTEVKLLYKQLRKLNPNNWVELIKSSYQEHNLPEDLIKLLSSLDSYKSTPSYIASEHSARLCGVPPDTYQLRTLQLHTARSRPLHGLSAKRGKRSLH